MKSVLGIVGGSGLYDLPGLTHAVWTRVTSPWGEPSDDILFAEIDVPQLLSIEIETPQARGAEPRDDALAIGDGRGGAEGIRLVCALGFLPRRTLLPQEFAVFAIEAHQRAPLDRKAHV